MKIFQIVLCFFLLSGISCGKTETPTFEEKDLVLIPQPKLLKVNKGSFEITEKTLFVIPEDNLRSITNILNDLLKKSAGFEIEISKEVPQNNFIELVHNSKIAEEGYELLVTSDKIVLAANSRQGFIYGLETIRQLLPKEVESASEITDINWIIPNVEISDAPQYSWRGNMLDVSRHFFGKEYIKTHLDRMAFLKLNTFHFHLVDDQGWRIEIKKYPKLTEVGAFRVDQEEKHWNARSKNNLETKATYGGYYTQDDIREIVAYAQEKGIRVVPEIEMPAHVMSAIAAYPWLSCTGEPIAVPSGGVWPITSIYCAGKESTFEFLEDVLTEVMELFPGKYIHVGGDEATKTNWKSCPDCQRRIKEEGLTDEHELQSYFMKRIEKFLKENNRTLIGWDEILEGGLPEDAAVMSWRGHTGGWEASKQGHDVVMTPTSHMYFDYYQGNPDYEPVAFNAFTPLKQVYNFRPVLDSMTVEQKRHILGGQANLWAEYISTKEHSEYMLFPRLAALAEVVWTPEDQLEWKDFSVRIQKLMERFEIMGINYAKSAYGVQPKSIIDLETGEITISLETEFPDMEIRYALEDSELTADAKVYKEPIKIGATSPLKAGVFKNGQLLGPVMKNSYVFHKAVAKPVKYDFSYNNSYTGGGDAGLVDVLRGSKNFKDGHWQGWINNPAIVTIDLERPANIYSVKVGTLEEQGAGIYFPERIIIEVSGDGEDYETVGEMQRSFSSNPGAKIQDFTIDFNTQNNIRFVRVTAVPLSNNPTGGGAWLFLDEIEIN